MANTVNRTIRSVLIIVTYIATVVVNYLSQVLPLNGVTAAEVSDSMPTLFAPAGYTFAIWGVIYFFLGAMVLYRIGAFGNVSSALLKSTDDWLIICSGLANIAWIFSWHYDHIFLSVIAIVILLITLGILYTRIARFRLEGANWWFVKVPVSVYFGWITVATIANISSWLVDIGWNGFGIPRQVWTIVVLVIGALIGIIGTCSKVDFLYGLVFIWSYVGILYKHLADKYWDGKYISVILTVIFCLIALVATEIITLMRKQNRDLISLRKEY